MTLFYILLFTLLSFNSWAVIPHKNEIDKIFAEFDKSDVPGASLGVIKNGKLIYARGYGMANLEYGIPNDEKSVFRIGSTSKQFTAACIVLLYQKGKLKLTDSLDKFFPEFPDYAKKVTIQHLLNHTSGIRDYLTLALFKGLRMDDYFDDKEVMHWLVKQQNLNFIPGEEFVYSNSGYWLLGQIVNKVAEMSMAEFAEQEIFKPLGMTHTHFQNDHNLIVKNRASGYSPKGEDDFKINMTTLNMIGDGGIFTTIEDILLWDNAYYQSKVLNKEFWHVMTKKGQLNNSEAIDYAAGLYIEDYKGLKTINHGGEFVGFRAELLRFPEQHVSIALFFNRSDADPSGMAFRVADILLKDDFINSHHEKPKAVKKIDLENTLIYTLNQLIGDYQVNPGVVLEFTIQGKRLHAHQSWNDKSYDLERINKNMYRIPDDTDIDFTFTELKDSFTQMLIIHQNGRDSDWKRKGVINKSKINLNDYTGEFYSPDLETTYTLYLKENQLYIRTKNKEMGELTIEGNDKFSVGPNELVFVREENKVSAVTVNAGRVKNLKFDKL